MAEINSIRIVLITGATRGLGRALALELASSGCKLLLCGRRRRDLQTLSEELPNSSNHVFKEVDVSEEEEVTRWKEELIREELIPDLLVNNAAIGIKGEFWKTAKEDFDKIISVNLLGVANVMRVFIPSMIDRKKGIIVNMSSEWGRSTSANVSACCASKWGLEGLTKSVAQELPSPLAAIPLNPGVIDTDLLRFYYGDSASEYPKPEAWAKVAAPFILNLSRESNGSSITVPA